MGMKQTLDILNGMIAAGVVTRYAVGGAIAAYNYIEATVTEDLDILVSFEGTDHQLRSGLVTLGPILAHLAERGYAEFNHEGVVIKGWPVQFLPVADALDAEALAQAAQVEVTINPTDGSVSTYILKAEHVVATALRVGRPKDRSRILQFVEEQAVDLDLLRDVLERHGLVETWNAFCDRVGIDNRFEAKPEAR